MAAKPSRDAGVRATRAAGAAAPARAARGGPAGKQAPQPVLDPARLRHDAFQIRLAAAVMAGSMVLWMVLQWLGARLGWEARYAFLIDFAAMAALVWSLAVTWRIWRRRQTAGTNGNER